MKLIERGSTSEKILMELSDLEISNIAWACDILRKEQRLDEKSRDGFQELYENFGCIGTYRAISDIGGDSR